MPGRRRTSSLPNTIDHSHCTEICIMPNSKDSPVVERALAAVRGAAAAKQISPGAAANINRWLTEAGYAAYLSRVLALVEAGRWEELDALFWEVIPFGTGGRRGLMAELGSATINERTIAESANGLAVYLRQVRGTAGGKAVIACDTRHRSAEFARLTATTLAAHGLRVFLFASHRSTPELSFAVRHLGCDVGVMISASHNPPGDNGVKAYWSNGAQVLPPHDKGIIDCVYQSNEIPVLDYETGLADGQIELIGEAVDAAYIAAVTALSLSPERELPGLYTPLHGVGETSVYRALQAAGFRGVQIFAGQRQPDGGFPNVPRHLPNPELPAVFEPPIAEARATGAELILASDPDADRLGAVVRDSAGNFVHLTGNRIAALLTDYVLGKRQAQGTLSPQHYIVETLVTTPLVAAIGRAHGVRVIDDLLVGFKYIAQTIDAQGPELFVFGAEESLGYLAGVHARDKDAAVAALYLAECAAELRRSGKTLLDRLDELYSMHGYFLESQKSESCPGPRGRSQIERLMEAFTRTPPAALGGVELARVRDYCTHEIRRLPENRQAASLPAPQGDMLIFESAPSDCEVVLAVRPSGTEPKIKFYFFARSRGGQNLDEIKARTAAKLQAFQESLSAWMKPFIT